MNYPLLITKQIIVFPNHSKKLIINRNIDKGAIDFSKKEKNNKFVLVSQNGTFDSDLYSEEKICKVGTLVEIVEFKKINNNEYEVLINSLERVLISSFNWNNKTFIAAKINILTDYEGNKNDRNKYMLQINRQINNLLSDSGISSDGGIINGVSPRELPDLIATNLQFPFEYNQALLEESNITLRLKLLADIIVDQSKNTTLDKEIDFEINKKLSNQQEEFLLREKIKVIKERLGDISTKDDDTSRWKELIEDKKYPEHVKKTITKEIKKFESMPSISAESHVIKGFIETILELPWNTFSKDSNDIYKARKILDKHHYGLEEVKKRIIEHLAVKAYTNSPTAPILALVGPPGVGKTSLGKSIAEAVDRKFVKVSLGGVKDESEIRGHRRTYVGALPGKIINAFKKAKTSNPVILLDEIDKMSSDFRGDPTSAMLEVLDPEQNKNFQDHYVELEYDLSQVMFLATANYYEQIPAPLIDRVELIFLDQYTFEEKIEIAKNYIIPQSIKNNGLKNAQFNISDKTIKFLIKKYTKEAGVRGLKREIDKLARKIVLRIIEKKIKTTYTITPKKINELLGKEKVYDDKLNKKLEIGLVNGMYYSSVGGGVLPIEVITYSTKKGGFKLTGSVKNVMKESLEIAIAYVRKNAQKFGIKFNFEENIIQVHVPEGATPKDGPSAGTAFTTAIISALKKETVPRNISFTGEITLRGNVLPIGGLKEKTIGAVELDIRKIFIPFANKKDLDDITDKVKEKSELIFVKDYMEIYDKVFNQK